MNRDNRPTGQHEQREHIGPEPLASERIESEGERKTFFLDLMENQRGRFVRLKERGVKTTAVFIPVESLRSVSEMLARMADWSDKNA